MRYGPCRKSGECRPAERDRTEAETATVARTPVLRRNTAVQKKEELADQRESRSNGPNIPYEPQVWKRGVCVPVYREGIRPLKRGRTHLLPPVRVESWTVEMCKSVRLAQRGSQQADAGIDRTHLVCRRSVGIAHCACFIARVRRSRA